MSSPPPPDCEPAQLDFKRQLPGLVEEPDTWSSASEDSDNVQYVQDALLEKRKRSRNMEEGAEDKKEKIRRLLVRKAYDVTDFYHERGCCQRLARSTYFESMTLFVIAVNAIWMAYDTDHNDAITLMGAKPEFVIMENFFCAYFTMEWTVRFSSFRRKCDCFKDGWFFFDSLLLLLMVCETWVLSGVLLISGSTSDEGIPPVPIHILRLFRLLRLTRMARMLRSISELMILIKGMAAAARSVFFVMCLLVIILYVFSIAFTQLAAGTVMGSYYFPTVQHSMYSLLIYGTFLDDIAPFCDEVGAESVACLLLIFVFAVLAACTVLNLLIGILCEVVSAVAATEREDIMVNFLTQKIQSLIESGDSSLDGARTISQEDFAEILKTPEAILALEEVGIDPVSIVDFFDHIFGREVCVNGTLNFSKFMEAILKLRQTNECTIKDMVDLRRYIMAQLGTAQEVVLEHLRKYKELKAARSPTLRVDLGLGDVSGTGSTSEHIGHSIPCLAGLKARTLKLEELMQTTLAEVKQLAKRAPSPEQTQVERTVVKATRMPRPEEASPEAAPLGQALPQSRRVGSAKRLQAKVLS